MLGSSLRVLATAALTALALAACTSADASPPPSSSPARFASAKTMSLSLGNETIAYRETGSGRPIVLLHRFRASMDDWDPLLIDALASHGLRVITFDSLGVGASTGAAPATIEATADVAARFVDALHLETVDVLGWSLGGAIAQVLAIKYPKIVEHLILAGTTAAGGDPAIAPPPRDWTQTAAKPTLTRADLLSLFFSSTPGGIAAGNASLDRTSVKWPAESIKVAPGVTVAQSAALLGFFKDDGHWYERLKEIECPTLVAVGDQDGSFPVLDSRILGREIPRARLVVYPDAGHAFLFQYAESFAADVAAESAMQPGEP